MPLVSVFMDVEDPINDFADDAALDVASLFTKVGVRGSFCLTGQKCRKLLERQRLDVLEAFSCHCLGLHTDTHSLHPTTMELLERVPYEDGCKLALSTERKGFDSFLAAFDRSPAFWGGAGNTWSPEITYALNRLGIPAYSYALTSLPAYAVHRYNGVVALPQAFSISELDWADNERATSRSESVLQSTQILETPWLGIFVGHPTKLRHHHYWDIPYNAGRNPDEVERAEPLDMATYQRCLANLEDFLGQLKNVATIVGVDDMLKLEWTFRKPNANERQYFREETESAIRGAARWPIHRPDLNPQKIVDKTMALELTLEVGMLD